MSVLSAAALATGAAPAASAAVQFDAHGQAARSDARGPVVHFRCTGGQLRLYRQSGYRPPTCDTDAPANRGICFTVGPGQAGFASVNNRSDKDLTVFPRINCSGQGISVNRKSSNEDVIIYSFARR
ncbi:hypothetical protein [Actinomadura terrae]|uniref:hypothetical protein n=1 Tax=Actinomadura terrae TaxID=604353 RepID=UPI001FA70280|nr:hypothetical protein [Actinomadura terrae]